MLIRLAFLARPTGLWDLFPGRNLGTVRYLRGKNALIRRPRKDEWLTIVSAEFRCPHAPKL
jgi:hypothetical protein